MRLLLTRPEPQATASREKLVDMGFMVTSEPCQYSEASAIDLQKSDAYIVTSVNGVQYGLSRIADKDAVVFAVGERTAQAAEKAGFEEIYAAEGNSESLFEMIMHRWPIGSGSLLHLSGSEIVSDISSLLSAIGYKAKRQIVYVTHAVERPSSTTLEALEREKIDAVLFYSGRSAMIFCDWVEAAGLGKCLGTMEAVVMSERIAHSLGEGWKRITVAKMPNEDALVRALGREA